MADLSKLKGVIRNTDSEQKQKNPIYSSMMYWSQKSSSICDALIEELTDKPEDVIFDPFLGSGVTLLESVSDKHNRICYGTEINEAPVFAVNTLLQKHDIRQIKAAFSDFLTKISFLDKEYLTTCPHCGSKAQIIQTRFDVVNGKKILKEIIYHCGCKAKRKNPDCDDISLFNAPRATSYIKNNELLYNSKLAVYKGEKIRDIFTERNFYVLDQIIGLSQKDPEIEELTKYILLSMMHLCKITDTHSNSQWPLWTPKTDCVEKNVLVVFRKKVKKLFDALEYENKNYHYANKMVANNGDNGARYRIHGDATLIGDMTGSTFNNNGLNGTFVQTSETSSFGDPTDGLPPGRRSIFDGNTFDNNGVDGVQLIATDASRVLVEITSNRITGGSGAHAAANTNGDTSISNNGRDGVHIETTGGRSDILITSGTGQTTIDGNGTTAGGNGIRWDASGPSDGVVRVTRTIITNNIRGATEDLNGDGVVNEDLNGNGVLDVLEDVNGNGLLDTAEDLNNNGDIDVVDGDGIQFNVRSDLFGIPTPTLIVGNVGEGNIIQNNQDNGIEINVTGGSFFGQPRPVISVVDNLIGGTSDGLDAGNGGSGLKLNVQGATDALVPGDIDFTVPPAGGADGDLIGANFTNQDGVSEVGPIVQLTMTGNTISHNDRRGVNLLITGAAGNRNREFGVPVFDPTLITLTDNTIVSNGEQGVYYRGDSQMNQSRYTYLANFPFPNPPFNPANDRPHNSFFYDPTQPEFMDRNIGSINGTTVFSPTAPDGDPGFLNLRTVQNTFLTIRDNTIANNGVNQDSGEGVYLRVGTGSYLAADIQDNAYGGNLDADVRTDSFLSFGNTFNSLDNAGDGTFDVVFWDDTAQLDMRFQNNSGNQIDTSSFGATYSNPDALKALVLGGFGVQFRDAAFFQVDNGPNLNNPNNSFTNFGVTQDIQNAFTVGGYNLRAAADPAFPNIGFAPFLP
jgi:hypothetical protein